MISWRQPHEGELKRWLTRRLNDPATAQDVLQDVFIKAMRQGNRFCEIANARAWLFEVSRHALTDHLRRHHDLEALPDDLPEFETDPPTAVDSLATCLPRVLAELSESDRDAIVQALLGKGAALGTVLAFMMSVIALSAPEMIILRKALKPRLIATFAGVVALGILLVGYIFNLVL